jgi:uncharacterized protein
MPRSSRVIRGITKGLNETIAQITGTPRESEAQTLRDDIARLEGYLPAQLGEAQLRTLIEGLIGEQPKSLKLMGSIMGKLRADHDGEYDPTVASRITKALLET